MAPLLAGAAVEIVSREELLEPERLLAVLERSTVAFTVPALLRRTLAGARERGAERFAALRALGAGADLVAPELQQELLAAFPAARARSALRPHGGGDHLHRRTGCRAASRSGAGADRPPVAGRSSCG